MNTEDALALKDFIMETERQRQDAMTIKFYTASAEGLNQPEWTELSPSQQQLFRNAYAIMIMAVDEMGRETAKQIMDTMFGR